MTAGPRSPGAGPRRHQPASSQPGTSRVPSACLDRSTTAASTPIDGIEIRAGGPWTAGGGLGTGGTTGAGAGAVVDGVSSTTVVDDDAADREPEGARSAE